jgi:cyclic pyranopterin phosphate synthase
MPASGLTWLPKAELLTYEELAKVVQAFARAGVCGVRLTGGEPTVRRDLVDLVRAIAAIDGIRDVAMTTNGHLFAPQAGVLAAAGLRRVNISLDSLDPEQFRQITRGGDLARVLDAIHAALAAGLTPVKINTVVLAGQNEDQIDVLVDHFAPWAPRVEVRFIEYMPFTGNDPARRHLPAERIRSRLRRRFHLEPASPAAGVGPATTFRLRENGLVVGLISPITEHFCHTCNRLRLNADGHLRTCLSRDDAPNLRDMLRQGATVEVLEQAIRSQVWGKVAGHQAHLDRDWSAFDGIMTRIGG